MSPALLCCCKFAEKELTLLARMLERMENARLIERKTSPDDSRINLVVLTEKARRLAAQFTPIRTLSLEAATEGLNTKEVVELRWMLNVVFENMNE
jgi:DNA-binding MarR family transcriptional regulator